MFSLLFALAIFLVTYLIGYATIYRRANHASINLEALATGIFLGAALFHMLPDATRQFSHTSMNKLVWPMMICLLSISLMSMLSKLVRFKRQLIKPEIVSSFLIAFMLSVHSLVEGVTLGLVQQFSIILIVFIAIVFHKSAASFALATHLLRNQYSQTRCHQTILLFSLLTPLGIFIGNISQHMASTYVDRWLNAIFLAVTAGTFLYIALFEYMLRWFRPQQKNLKQNLMLCSCGIVIMGVLTLWV